MNENMPQSCILSYFFVILHYSLLFLWGRLCKKKKFKKKSYGKISFPVAYVFAHVCYTCAYMFPELVQSKQQNAAGLELRELEMGTVSFCIHHNPSNIEHNEEK